MHRQWKLYLSALTLALLVLIPSSRVKADDDNHVTFTTIDFPGAVFTNALGINPRGDIVGRYDSADHRTHGWLLRRENEVDGQNNDGGVR